MENFLPLSLQVSDDGFRFRFADVALAASARQLFIAYLRSQAAAEADLFNVELVFGELLGNVARHAPGPVDVNLIWEQTGARLEVWDTGPGYELNVALPDLFDECRRGLFIVAQCSSRLHVERRGCRTVTSATLPVRRAGAPGPPIARMAECGRSGHCNTLPGPRFD